VLGPTDPAKAPSGTIRKEFGTSIMINAAHASDAPENAAREIGLLQVADNSLKGFVESVATAA
jgi:nucleoside diphosphate kinase